MSNNLAFVYGYFNTKTKKPLYIGICTTPVSERHANHMKPSKIDVQKVNRYLQENDDWVIVTLAEFSFRLNDEDKIKDFIHINEQWWVSQFNPELNTYLK